MSALNSCSSQFVVKGCECLTDPMDPTNPICAYVSRDNGLVYPCDIGCCQPNCGTKLGHQPRMDVEFRQTFGGTLPPGFNKNLETSGEGTPEKYESPFEPVTNENPKVKDIVLKLGLSLVVILLLALYIGLKT